MVALRGDARGGPGGQLRNPAGPVRGRARADRRHDGPGRRSATARRAGSINWYILHDPFTFVTFWIYVTCAVASTNRAPFDLPEAESELVAGFLTEYSGFRWVIFFMAEYAAMFAVSGLAAMLFLGGWNGPVPIAVDGSGLMRGDHEHGALGWIGNLLGMCNFIAKAVVGVTVHDLAPLDAAAAADRPGDDHLLEILRAAGLGDAGRRDALDAISCPAV